MLLKSIELENIRSYKDRTLIAFPNGRTLFQGDIGSGKSTILSAIEFALFGLGDIDANHLLRVGAAKGSVFLEFESDKQIYKVYRSLTRRRDKIVQNEGYLYENGTRSSYSVSELKTKILEIIKINERTETKTTSIVYRYAIYTPQEMMKQILSSNNERRLDILRRAFGIEEYITAKRNAEKFLSGLRIVMKNKKNLVADLDESRSALHDKKEQITILKNDITAISSSIEQTELKMRVIEENLSLLTKVKEQLLELDVSLRTCKTNLSRYEKEKTMKSGELDTFNHNLSRAEEAEKVITNLDPVYKDLASKRLELTTLADSAMQYDRLSSEKLRLETIVKNESEKLRTECSRLRSEVDDMAEELERDQAEIAKLDDLKKEEVTLKESVTGVEQARSEFQVVTDRIAQINAKLHSVKSEISKERAAINKILELSHQALCPCCGQRLTPEHVAQMVERFNQTKHSLETECSTLQDKRQVLEQEKLVISNKIDEFEKLKVDLNSISIKISALQVKKSALDSISEKMTQKIFGLEDLTAKSENNNFAIKERASLDSLSDRLNLLSDAKRLYEDCQRAIAVYQKDDVEKRYLENVGLVQSKSKTVEQIELVQKSMTELDKEIQATQNEILELESACKSRSVKLEKLPQLESEKLRIADQLASQRQDYAVRNARVRDAEEYVLEVSKKIESLEKKLEGLLYMENVGRWLDDCFIPSLDVIESHVMTTINEGFMHLFQKWFNLLVDSPEIVVELDKCFAPVVHQNGNIMEVDTLSGGEKTAIAMAYRLALNEVIKRLANMDDNLLILDEPTDGFSKEQMYQLKYVFDGLSASQVIIVSHEKELEGFVECTCRVVKEGDCSRVEITG
jgi:DNA repair protein SbcC/Rad50